MLLPLGLSLVCAAAAVSAAEFPEPAVAAELVAAVRRHYSSGCVRLLYTAGLPGADTVVKIARHLTLADVQTAAVEMRTLGSSLLDTPCRRERPLYVLTVADEEARLRLNQYPPELDVRRVNGKVIVLGGYASRIWAILERTLNFTLEYHDVDDPSWGRLLPNNSWGGYVGMMARGDVELSANLLGMLEVRVSAGDYSQPLLASSSLVFIREPEGEASGWQAILVPFSAPLWLALLCVIPSIGLLLTVLHYVSRRSMALLQDDSRSSLVKQTRRTHNRRQHMWIMPELKENRRTESSESGILDFLYCAITIFSIQGVSVAHLSQSCKMMVFVTNLMAVVMMTAYCSKLISQLTVRDVRPPFTNFEGLLKLGSSYRLTVMKGTNYYTYFQKTQDPVLSVVYARFIQPQENSLPGSHVEGLRRVCSEKRYAFFTQEDMMRHEAAALPCFLLALHETALSDNSAIMYRKLCPYRGIIATSLEDLRRTGVLNLLKRQTWPVLVRDVDFKFSSVEITTVDEFFKILAFGLGTALLALVLEVLRRHRQMHTQARGRRCRP